jgi:hypothetical protein
MPQFINYYNRELNSLKTDRWELEPFSSLLECKYNQPVWPTCLYFPVQSDAKKNLWMWSVWCDMHHATTRHWWHSLPRHSNKHNPRSCDDISLATMLHGMTNVDVVIEWFIWNWELLPFFVIFNYTAMHGVNTLIDGDSFHLRMSKLQPSRLVAFDLFKTTIERKMIGWNWFALNWKRKEMRNNENMRI